MAIQLLLFCVAILIVALLCWSSRSRKLVRPPTFDGAWPIIGVAPMLIGDSKHAWKVVKKFCYECLEKGGIMYGSFGPFSIYVITDPDDCYTVSNNCLDKIWAYDFAKPWIGDSLLRAYVPVWKPHRRILNHAFVQNVLDEFVGVFNEQARHLVDDMAKHVGKGLFDHAEYLELRSLETTFQTAMGINELDDSSFKIRQHTDAVRKILNIYVQRFQAFWMHSQMLYNWTSLKKQEDETIQILHTTSDRVIQKKKSAFNERKASRNVSGKKFKAFLDLLLELPSEDSFTDAEIRGEVDGMIIAASDTTATSLRSTLVLLGSHPDIQERVYKELQEVFGDSERNVEKEDLTKLVYLEAVIKESLRLYPTCPVQPRSIKEDIKLKNYTLPAGSNCFMLVYGLQHDPKLWGPDVEQFKPDRWLNPATLPANPNAFAAFSFGRRVCIGKAYALMVMKTNLVHLLRQYRFSADHTKLEFKIDVMLKPAAGCEVAIERRT